jgi:signal transduction histidine kinase
MVWSKSFAFFPEHLFSTWLTRPQPSSCQNEYRKWRQQFLLDRIKLVIWFAMAILLGLSVLHLGIFIPAINASGEAEHFVSPERTWLILKCFALQEMGLLSCLLLLRSTFAQRYPTILFMLTSWSILLLPQLQALLRGEVLLDSSGWIIGYMAQAILVPVRWRMHLVSQISTLGLFTGGMLLGFRDPEIPTTLTVALLVLVAFYTLFVCLIADVGVYLYERLLRRDFELRQHLRLFLHAVSHDLRNPILGMVMLLRNLQNDSGEDARIPQRVLSQMIDSGDRQIQLINLLLETHEAETVGITLNRRTESLSALVHDVVRDLQPFITEAQATVSCNISEMLPLLDVDPLQLRRVYENLIANALRHNPHGIQITLNACQDNDQILCTVSDTGEGIPPPQCHALFELYGQGPSARQTLGWGLGMHICRQIIDAHGGKIGATSHPGKGTTFWFTLPLTHHVTKPAPPLLTLGDRHPSYLRDSHDSRF